MNISTHDLSGKALCASAILGSWDDDKGYGDVSAKLNSTIIGFERHYRIPYSSSFRDIKTTYCKFRDQWKAETAYLSSVHSIISNLNYLKIIGLGDKVVPLILEDLKREEDMWFTALEVLTGENPVPQNVEGNIESMSRYWILWGQKRGLI